MKRYEAYKDSGVDWIGEVPEGWEILPSKRYFNFEKKINKNYFSNNILSLTLRGVVNNDIENPEGLVPKDYATYQFFQKGDLVFKLIDLENISTSRVGIVHEDGIMSSAYIRLICGPKIFNKYAYYFYFSLYKNQVFNKLGSGVRSTLNPTDLLNLAFVNPSFSEQTAIAEFLDDKTAKIDQTIGIRQKEIDLLKERRQILIQQAVTGKIVWDASTNAWTEPVEVKDSGVDWIGEIPEHWEVRKLKYLISEFNVRSIDGTEELLSLSKYKGVIPKSTLEERAGGAESHIGYKIVRKNDLVINKMQAVNGLLAVSRISGITSPDYSVYFSKNSKHLNIYYLQYLLLQSEYLSEFKRRVTGVMEGFIRLYTDDLYEIKIHLPKFEEQLEIVSYIKAIEAKIAKAITLKEQEIEKLKEYKTVLIDNVVTGKVKIN